MDFLSYFALAILFLVVLVLSYGMIAIHDIPYHIALKRDHPHADAIHAGGWISLFTLHAIWPFLWIWATAYHPEHGYAGTPGGKPLKPARWDSAKPQGWQRWKRKLRLWKRTRPSPLVQDQNSFRLWTY